MFGNILSIAVIDKLHFYRANDGDVCIDHTDAEVLEIAERITVDQYYNLGVALGFHIKQIDVFQFRRLNDRQHATYDMLIRWIHRQGAGEKWKDKLLDVIKSAEQIDIPGNYEL